MDICVKVKDIRKQLKMTQVDFSKELGVDGAEPHTRLFIYELGSVYFYQKL